MNQIRTAQAPLQMGDATKSDVRSQFAALCYRVEDGAPEVLLITSRGTGRWILPRGWPMDGMTPAEAAAQEAWEEAGVRGKVRDLCIGIYAFNKELDDGQRLPCIVSVFPLKVKTLAKEFPEAKQRKRKWFSPAQAASRVNEPELKRLLQQFDPGMLK